MEEIKILSFAKINLSIDVTGITEDGMHTVDMIMHQISFSRRCESQIYI